MVTGKIHSIESMGLVDGPGVRSVVFFSGCRLRCLYCHNPDTWCESEKCFTISSDKLTERLLRFKTYFGQNGGVTFSGGEPLLQASFAAECFTLLKRQGIHTCLDTSGVGQAGDCRREDILSLLSVTDLVLLDIKHYDRDSYKEITGLEMNCFEEFLDLVQSCGNKLWLRHVVVPDLTDGDIHIRGLKNYISGIKNVEKVELLPYHTLGKHKYEKMGLKYRLGDTPSLTRADMKPYYDILNG